MVVSSTREFGRLLSEGVYRIKLREGKSIQLVHDQLGYAIGRDGGSAIEHWRRGNAPAELADLEKLAAELVRWGQLDRSWLQLFLRHGRHPEPERMADLLFGPETAAAPLPGAPLPDRSCRTLVGRDRLAAELVAAIADPDGRWLVAIDGQGGIGKTALAREVAERCQVAGQVDGVIWISAARADPAVAEAADAGLTVDRLLNLVGEQLGQPDVARLPQAEKAMRLQLLLRQRRVLLVLDNLETAPVPQAELAAAIRPFLNPCKALLTSRHRFRGDVYAVHLTGLEAAGGVALVRQDAAEKGIHHVSTAETADLQPIVQTTGGSPLALKLVVSQLAFLAWPVIAHELRAVRAASTGEDAYVRFYRHLFDRSWALLGDGARRLLLAMAHFVPGSGGSFEALQTISDLPHEALIAGIDALWQLSFLEVGEAARLRQIRYYLHPLTQNFVLSDIVGLELPNV